MTFETWTAQINGALAHSGLTCASGGTLPLAQWYNSGICSLQAAHRIIKAAKRAKRRCPRPRR